MYNRWSMWRGDHHLYGGEMGGMDDHESWMTEVLGYESTSCIIDDEDGHGHGHGHDGLSRDGNESDGKVSRDLDPQATPHIPRNFPPPLSSSSLTHSSTLRSFKSNGRLVLTLIQHMPSPNVVVTDDAYKPLPLIKRDKPFLHTFLHFTLIPSSISLEPPLHTSSCGATRPSFPKVAQLNSTCHDPAQRPFAIHVQLSDSLCNIQPRIEDRFPLIVTQFSLFRDTRASIRT